MDVAPSPRRVSLLFPEAGFWRDGLSRRRDNGRVGHEGAENETRKVDFSPKLGPP